MQAIAAAWLIYRLKGRYPLRMAGRDAMKNLSKFLGPTGESFFWPIAWCETAKVMADAIDKIAFHAGLLLHVLAAAAYRNPAVPLGQIHCCEAAA